MIEPKPLPFAPHAGDEGQTINTLEPHISYNTVGTHYEKHYKGYIKNLNKLIENTDYEDSSLEKIIMNSAGPIFNNAAQVYNHEFYFNCLTDKKTSVSGKLEEAIESKWKSIDAFKEDFNKVAKRLFGSGWAWLVWDTFDESLDILVLENAGTPLRENVIRPEEKYIPLMCCDLWEHSRYLDYKHDTGAYLDAFWKVFNWDFVNQNFEEI